jgi:tripartite-type tricarboxylate transporter receptor subunit TctC
MRICRFNQDRIGLVEGSQVLDITSRIPSAETHSALWVAALGDATGKELARLPLGGSCTGRSADAKPGSPSVSLNLAYDPAKDFEAISNIADVPNVFVVGQKFKSLDLAGGVQKLKAEPGKYSFESSGAGGLSNINGELFQAHDGCASPPCSPTKGWGPP